MKDEILGLVFVAEEACEELSTEVHLTMKVNGSEEIPASLERLLCVRKVRMCTCWMSF